MSFLASITSNNVVLYADYQAIDADSNFIRTVRLKVPEEYDIKQAFLLLLFQSSIHGCSLLMPKKCFSEVGYFDENLRTTQDYDLWFKLLKSGYEFRHMPEVLISSRWHEAQGTRSLYKIAQVEIEALYVDAVDTFYDDIERLSVTTIMELIVDLRERKLGKTANHILKSIKLRNKRLYQLLYGEYSGLLFTSKVKLMAAKPIHLCKVITDLLNIRGGA
jgi:GT2 family glycosyltransferase